MPTHLPDVLRHLHAWPLQTQHLGHNRVSQRSHYSSRCDFGCRASAHSRFNAHLFGLASAACLIVASPLAHADEDVTRSFNRNCIGELDTAL